MTSNERIDKLRLAWAWLTVSGRKGEAAIIRDNVRVLTAIEWHRVRQETRRPERRLTYKEKASK